MDILQKWGEPGIGIYKKHFFVDYPHAFIYASFLASVIGYLMAEQDREAVSGTLIKVSAAMTWMKWGLAGISIMAIIFLVLKKTMSQEERRF